MVIRRIVVPSLLVRFACAFLTHLARVSVWLSIVLRAAPELHFVSHPRIAANLIWVNSLRRPLRTDAPRRLTIAVRTSGRKLPGGLLFAHAVLLHSPPQASGITSDAVVVAVAEGDALQNMPSRALCLSLAACGDRRYSRFGTGFARAGAGGSTRRVLSSMVLADWRPALLRTGSRHGRSADRRLLFWVSA